jgi:predicted DNA-binding transcriptional regulator YafY
MLQVSCRTVDEMASEFAVSRRTIYRDLRLIDQASLPLVTRQVGKAFRLVRAPHPPVTLPGAARTWA